MLPTNRNALAADAGSDAHPLIARRAAAYGEMALTVRASVSRAVETVMGFAAEFSCPSAATVVRID
jgi:hypothetical protein